MKWSILACSLLLAGCNHMPAKPDWPKAPNVESCPEQLKDAPVTEKLSVLMETVTANYGTYHECKARVEAWQQWYKDQKKIYEEAK